jgi:ABC-2 type transport system ATP-binding protein
MVDTMSAPDTSGARRVNAGTDEIAIRTRGLTKLYGERLAVNNLNLEVYRGDIFGFLGPNGAGKTTTIRMMLRLITPTHGSIEILGHDVASQSAEILPRVGALVETPALYLYMSGRDNLRAVGAVLGGVPESRIDAVLELVRLKGRDKDRVKTYSLGMKQRLGVAMALLHSPDLLILDEPANGLDPAGIVEMRDLMRALATQGKTVFISSHVLTEVQQICTRVAIINNGRLVTESTVEALTQTDGVYAVKVREPAEALALVKAQPWGMSAQVDAYGYLVTASPDGEGRSLNLFLSQAGHAPDLIMYKSESLEDVFLRLTSSAPNGAPTVTTTPTGGAR